LWDFHYQIEGVDFMRSTTDCAASHKTAGIVGTSPNGVLSGTIRNVLLSLVLAGGISSGSAIARSVIIEIAPPPARVEVVPVLHHGYTWAPGYWSWQRGQHVWVNGHTMRARNGYEWAPDHWNEVHGRHEFQHGHWARVSERQESHAQ
jgi:hypothetical protein